MLATFILTEPMLLAAALGVLASAGWLARRRKRAGRRDVLAAAAGAGLGLVAGVLLALAGTPAAGAMLFVLALSAAVALAVVTYRAEADRLGRRAARVCTAARAVVWVVLLVLLARPQWSSSVIEWDKPLLEVVLDDSRSMAIVDRGRADGRSRAQVANRALDAARARLAQLERYYELHFVNVGDGDAGEGWRIVPRAPASPLAAALRRAGQSRSTHGGPPIAIVLVSDGAENVVGPDALREVGRELAAQKTALLALGVGPAAGSTPMVQIEPLVVPGRVGSRDRLRVPVVARVEGCAGRKLHVSVAWGDRTAAERDVSVRNDPAQLDEEFELRPPGVGLHRLSAVVRLPAELGGEPFETSAIVDVRDDRIHVLLVEAQPRNAMAFAVRAIAGDARFDVSQRLLLAAGPGTSAGRSPIAWGDYDVVVLGAVPARRLGRDNVTHLADAVRDGGVGLLLAGGRTLFHDTAYNGSLIEEISPCEFRARKPPDDYRPRWRPTRAGLRHPVLRGIGQGAPGDVWDRLPPLGGAARFGSLKPLAVVLATDADGRPLLVAQEAGRGRVLAAAWDSIWPWALASDEGLAVHHQLWRQMLAWLANRRPIAWIVTDRSDYARDALATGRQIVRIRAGLSGGQGTGAETQPATTFRASLRLRRTAPMARVPGSLPAARSGQASAPSRGRAREEPRMVVLRREGDDWVADLPRDLPAGLAFGAGTYALELTIERVGGERGPGVEHDVFTARTSFAVRAVDLEMTEPTANLTLLRELAAVTRPVGGEYHPVQEVAGVAAELLQHDQRRRIEHRTRYDPVARRPWVLFVIVIAALTTEWVIRKRGGLA